MKDQKEEDSYRNGGKTEYLRLELVQFITLYVINLNVRGRRHWHVTRWVSVVAGRPM